MRIGEAADELGINTKTIRYYESIELIPAAPRPPAGYRDYADEDVDRLEFIRTWAASPGGAAAVVGAHRLRR